MAVAIPLLVIVGPTASGKSALALDLAERVGGEIVSFDSMQLYRGFEIGTASPTAAELARVPHHFIGEADPERPWTAGEYARQARPRIRAIAARGRVPVLVGGTGFYLRALLSGLSEAPPRVPAIRQRLRERVARRGPAALHRLLRRLDPQAAAGIAPRDAARIIRALEVRLASGRRLSEFWRQPPLPFAEAQPYLLGLDPPRAALYSRIDSRAAGMFQPPGIVEETRQLAARYGPRLPALAAHGYKQALDILHAASPPAQALLEAQREQRQYAKRQLTWLRRQVSARWLRGFGDDPAIQAEAWELVKRALADRPAPAASPPLTPPARKAYSPGG